LERIILEQAEVYAERRPKFSHKYIQERSLILEVTISGSWCMNRRRGGGNYKFTLMQARQISLHLETTSFGYYSYPKIGLSRLQVSKANLVTADLL
jgi:hypothetical protein